MPLPAVGETAPDFTLQAYASGATHHLADTTAKAPTLLVFAKRMCVCSRMTMPFVERLHQRYPALQVLGVSQDEADETKIIVQQGALTFPMLLDPGWQTSIAYDIIAVPTLVLLETGGTVKRVQYGWQTANIEALGADVAHLMGAEPQPLVTDGDKMPAFKPGCSSKHLDEML